MNHRKDTFLTFMVCVLAAPTCAILIGELRLPDGMNLRELYELTLPWLALGVLLGGAHLLLRPILRFLSAPLGCLTLGLFGFVIDVAMIYGCAALVDNFEISGLLYAILTAVLINALCSISSIGH